MSLFILSAALDGSILISSVGEHRDQKGLEAITEDPGFCEGCHSQAETTRGAIAICFIRQDFLPPRIYYGDHNETAARELNLLIMHVFGWSKERMKRKASKVLFTTEKSFVVFFLVFRMDGNGLRVPIANPPLFQAIFHIELKLSLRGPVVSEFSLFFISFTHFIEQH